MSAKNPDQPNELQRGLPMVEARDPEALDQEKQLLANINDRPHFWQRWQGYWGLSGPGWVQSALTLGAGSASAAIFAGAVYGYKLLWVQPVAMFLGVMMFAAIGHQLLTTRARPYDVFRKKLHPSLALLWGFNVFLASVIWQFPQYSLGTAVFKDVVIKTGINWGQLFRGFFSFHIPTDKQGITIVLGQLGAAVGVNMTFLYPYTLLARGWGKKHRGLKNFDLGTSMFIPFVLATSFVIIACANTLHTQGIQVKDAVDVAHALQPLAGLTFGRLVFSLGVLSMCLTTLIIEMLICGFVLSEMLNFEFHGRAYRISTMIANIGIIGAFYKLPLWLPVIVSSFNLVMMPVAYIGFFILQNKKNYLGKDVSHGAKGTIWNIILIVAILVVAVGAAIKILSILGFWQS